MWCGGKTVKGPLTIPVDDEGESEGYQPEMSTEHQ